MQNTKAAYILSFISQTLTNKSDLNLFGGQSTNFWGFVSRFVKKEYQMHCNFQICYEESPHGSLGTGLRSLF
jgi:hypothetical protein